MKVMTFNLKNSGISRNAEKKILSSVELINDKKPDVVGTQELTVKNKNILEEYLKNYFIIGDSRNSIGITDEHNSILLRKDTIKLLSYETYSLSNNIYKKGSKFPFDAFPRICTVSHIIYDNKQYLIVNTHLDNALLINRKLQLDMLSFIIKLERKDNEELIIVGDFNMKVTGPLSNFCNEFNLQDAAGEKIGSSYNGLKLYLDHIFYSNGLIYSDSELIKEKYNGIKPSDHYPILTNIKRR